MVACGGKLSVFRFSVQVLDLHEFVIALQKV